MEKKPEQIHPDRWLKDLPLQTKGGGFKPEEVISCPECHRISPPNRLKCLYCNSELPVTETKFIKPVLRKLENWEKGFNIIFLPEKSNASEIEISGIEKFLSVESEELRKFFNLNKSLPIARVESEREAEIIRERLKEFGAESFILSDEDLKIETIPRRLRRIEFTGEKLIFIHFNSVELTEILREDLCLIVSGALFERKIESIEKYRRKKENKILQATEFSADETLIDIYIRNDAIGYRLTAGGFDFSCLGAEKQLFAIENMKTLIEKLKAFAPNAIFDNDYRRIRFEISQIWEVEERKNSKGIQKNGVGKLNLESVTTISNLTQFTKYSRLQWHLL